MRERSHSRKPNCSRSATSVMSSETLATESDAIEVRRFERKERG